MVPTAKEMLFSKTNLFTGLSIQDLMVINQDMCEKPYHINTIQDLLFDIFIVQPPPRPF